MAKPIPLQLPPFHLASFQGAPTGFSSPVMDDIQDHINLYAYLLQNKHASFLFRMCSESMSGIGIYSGDTLIVDRSIIPLHNHIVLAIVEEEFTVKRLYKRGGRVKLMPENPVYPVITFREEQELRIWGVVTFNLHRLLNE